MDEPFDGRIQRGHAMNLQEALLMGYFSAGLLVIYAGLQSALSIFFGGANPQVKMLIEPFMICIGLALHVQWRKVTLTIRDHDLERPRWVAVGDALSFMITFWAFCCLIEAFLQKAKLL